MSFALAQAMSGWWESAARSIITTARRGRKPQVGSPPRCDKSAAAAVEYLGRWRLWRSAFLQRLDVAKADKPCHRYDRIAVLFRSRRLLDDSVSWRHVPGISGSDMYRLKAGALSNRLSQQSMIYYGVSAVSASEVWLAGTFDYLLSSGSWQKTTPQVYSLRSIAARSAVGT